MPDHRRIVGPRHGPVRRVPFVAAVLAMVVAFAGTAFPETAVAPVVAERRESMKAMAEAARTISGIFDGKLTYDGAAFKEAAEIIRRRSGSAMADEFPAGSFGAPSAAKAEIGQSREEFEALAHHLESLAAALSAAADRAPDGVTQDMRMAPRKRHRSSRGWERRGRTAVRRFRREPFRASDRPRNRGSRKGEGHRLSRSR